LPAKPSKKPPIAVRCLLDQADALREDADRLRQLFERIDQPEDLPLPQWAHWYGLALQFRPDLIVELGREAGNSTCVFTQAAYRLGRKTKVKSFCLSQGWENQPAVADLVEADWFDALEVHSGDLTEIDFGPLLEGASRVLLLWDAHGFAVADHVLSHVMPLLAGRPHLVLCHDMDDNRLPGVHREYDGRSCWRGADDFWAHKQTRARLNLSWLSTWVDQALPILDFCWRNRIELHSPGFELQGFRKSSPAAFRKLAAAIPDDLLDRDCACHWSYFTLNETRSPHQFPAPAVDFEQPRDRIIELEHLLDKMTLKKKELQRELRWRRPDAKALRQRIEALEAERAEYERLVHERIAALEREIHGLRGSLSWRLTQPLRNWLSRFNLPGRGS